MTKSFIEASLKELQDVKGEIDQLIAVSKKLAEFSPIEKEETKDIESGKDLKSSEALFFEIVIFFTLPL